jgi:hypothetical protein
VANSGAFEGITVVTTGDPSPSGTLVFTLTAEDRIAVLTLSGTRGGDVFSLDVNVDRPDNVVLSSGVWVDFPSAPVSVAGNVATSETPW